MCTKTSSITKSRTNKLILFIKLVWGLKFQEKLEIYLYQLTSKNQLMVPDDDLDP